MLQIVAILLILGGGVAMRSALAQTAGQKPLGHEDIGGHRGHPTGGPAEGAFQHRFEDADKWAKEFDDQQRDAWQKPEEVLDALHLERSSIVADIGAGTGYFSVRIAKRVPEGKLFAADVEPDMVRYLGERAQ